MSPYVDMLLESPLIDVVDARDGYAVAVDWLLDRGATLDIARWSVTAARLERDARWKDRYLVVDLSLSIVNYWLEHFRQNLIAFDRATQRPSVTVTDEEDEFIRAELRRQADVIAAREVP